MGAALRSPLGGRLFWAGADYAEEGFGYISGAIESSKRAVGQITADVAARDAAARGARDAKVAAETEAPPAPFPFCDGAESDKCKVCPSSGTVKKVCVMNDYKSQVQCLDCTKEENHRDCVDSECIKPDPNPCGPGKTCQGCASGMVCVGYACLDCNAQQNYKACDAAGCDFRFLQFARVAELS